MSLRLKYGEKESKLLDRIRKTCMHTIKRHERLTLNGYVNFESRKITFKVETKIETLGVASSLDEAIEIFDRIVEDLEKKKNI